MPLVAELAALTSLAMACALEVVKFSVYVIDLVSSMVCSVVTGGG